jgi:glycosyltransferase involved in cell wall biosynthesis
MKNDLVSVIMPTYNSRAFVRDSIASIRGQTYENWELLIIDDASTDDTVATIEKAAQGDPRIRILRSAENAGAAEARNRGIQEARGRYIAFLDSDDQWLPRKLERQVDLMRANSWAFTFTAYDKIDEQGRKIGHVGIPKTTTYRQLLKTCVIGCLTAMYDTEVLGKVPMPLIRKRQDFGLWLRLLKKTPRAYGIQETLALYRVRTDSVSAKKSNAAHYTWKLYREVEQLSLIASLWYFAHYAIRGVLRHHFPSVARRIGVLQVTEENS